MSIRLPLAEGEACMPVARRWRARPELLRSNWLNIRPLPLGLTTAIHLLLFGLLMLPGQRTARAAEAEALSTFDVAPPAPSAPAPPAEQPKPVIETPPEPILVPPPEVPPVETPVVVALLKQADAQAASGACDLSAPVEAALRVSSDVKQTLPLIPPSRRSVANAIMVWNAQWTAPEAEPDNAAMTAVRGVVAEIVAAASEACRLQPQTGPRLLTVPAANETIVLALGSGQWRWQDMLDTAQPEQAPSEEATAGAHSSDASETSSRS